MTRRADPLVLDRRLEPLDLRWLVADEACRREIRTVRASWGGPRLTEWLAEGWGHVGLVVGLVLLAWLLFGGR